jgi:phosphate-selective porin OprO and OprP
MNNVLARTAALAAALLVLPAAAQPAPAAEELDQRLKAVERKLELEAEKDKTANAGEKGFGLKSADGAYEFKFRGLMQLDARFFADDEQTLTDTFLVRRLEPTFELTLGKLAFVKIQPQFAGDTATTADVYGELRFDPALGLRFGKFKTPLGLEYLQGTAPLLFVERGLPTEVGAGRDIGVQLQGEVLGGTTTYALAWVNGAPDGRDAVASDTDDKKELAARVFVEPFRNEPGFFRGLGFGVAATRGSKVGAANAATFNNTLPRYRSPGQHTVFTYIIPATAPSAANTVIAAGDHGRLSPQLYFYRGPFSLLAEHMSSGQDVSFNGAGETLEHTAWQAAVGYVLTGEDASYKGFKPASPFVRGAPGWGAFEVALRHGVLDIDDAAFPTYADPAVSVTEMTTTAVALNWYLTGNARITLDYGNTAFDGGAATGDRLDEAAVFTRLQLGF